GKASPPTHLPIRAQGDRQRTDSNGNKSNNHDYGNVNVQECVARTSDFPCDCYSNEAEYHEQDDCKTDSHRQPRGFSQGELSLHLEKFRKVTLESAVLRGA